jgi:hypothetical protein
MEKGTGQSNGATPWAICTRLHWVSQPHWISGHGSAHETARLACSVRTAQRGPAWWLTGMRWQTAACGGARSPEWCSRSPAGDEGGLNVERRMRGVRKRGPLTPSLDVDDRRARRGGAMTFGGGTRSGQKRRRSSTWRISSTRLLCSSTCVEERRRRRSGPSSRR